MMKRLFYLMLSFSIICAFLVFPSISFAKNVIVFKAGNINILDSLMPLPDGHIVTSLEIEISTWMVSFDDGDYLIYDPDLKTCFPYEFSTIATLPGLETISEFLSSVPFVVFDTVTGMVIIPDPTSSSLDDDCYIDTDGDGIVNCDDACPNDPQNDADQDGVCGDVDLCQGGDDKEDVDGDGIPDFCDREVQPITAAGSEGPERFGSSVSVSGTQAIVGAYLNDDNGPDSGSVYIQENIRGVWAQQTRLTAGDGAATDLFGYAVSISGDLAIVGAYQDDDMGRDSGSAYIFEKIGGIWSQAAKLTAGDGAPADRFGYAVSISGDQAIVGAYQDSDKGKDSGSAYIFEKIGGTWTQAAKLAAGDGEAGDRFGLSVSISGDQAIIGAHGYDMAAGQTGAAYIFEKSSDIWSQSAILTAGDGMNNDYFGWSVAISGDQAIVGANRDDTDDVEDAGSAYIFEKVSGTWTQIIRLSDSDSAAQDYFGWSVAIADDQAVVGAQGADDNGTDSGSAHIFEKRGGVWVQTGMPAAGDGKSNQGFGWSVGISGGQVVVGAGYWESAYIINSSIHMPGTEKWCIPISGGVYGAPSIGDDGTIYVGTNSDHSKVQAISPGGIEKWAFELGGRVYGSSAAIGPDGTIYVGTFDDNMFYAINPDGTEKWRFVALGPVCSSPAIGSDGTIYVGSNDNNLYAINPDGTKEWSFLTDNAVSSSPAIRPDGTIYVGSHDHNLYAINPDGTEKWVFPTGNNVYASPAIGADGTIYVGSADNNLYAIRPNGNEKWRFTAGLDVRSSAAIGPDGTIYVGSYDGNVYAVNPDDGTEKWRFTTGAQVPSSPAVGADGTVFICSLDKNLYALDPADGSMKWSVEAGQAPYTSPTIGPDGTVYMGANDSLLYAVYSNSGGLADSPWPMFHHDLKLTGLNKDACPDTDGDGRCNYQDSFPNDPTEWSDNDDDGEGNNSDPDDDNDDVEDSIDCAGGIDIHMEDYSPGTDVTVTDTNGNGVLETGEIFAISVETSTNTTIVVGEITGANVDSAEQPPAIEINDESTMTQEEIDAVVEVLEGLTGIAGEAESVDVAGMESSELTEYLGTDDYDILIKIETALTPAIPLCMAELKSKAIILFCDGQYDLETGICTGTLVTVENRCENACTDDGPISDPDIFDICYRPVSQDPDMVEVRNIPHSTTIISIVLEDADEDGVADEDDNCPGTDNPDQANSDGDWLGDACDNCPNDSGKTEPGLCGCDAAEVDADVDGTPDCNDGCPEDPHKADPGECGCGISETDSDDDGTIDCHEECPDDPDKVIPGECGCGVPDTDTDTDGTPDCNDGCPDDSGKTDPGICGCNVPDMDSDGDETYDCHDNCPDAANEDQSDTDEDKFGNVCDNCPDVANADQADDDGDGIGDACDTCPGDYDRDGDVDGSDLADFAASTEPADLGEFASEFGRADCD